MLTSSSINFVKDGAILSGKDLAQSLNTYFLSVNNDLPSLDLSLLSAYLPAPQPIPVITPDEVCTKLLKIKSFKSNGPDNIPNRIIKEFAYELADPVCSIFNTSLTTGEFPDIWKDALITPILHVRESLYGLYYTGRFGQKETFLSRIRMYKLYSRQTSYSQQSYLHKILA